MHGFKFFKISKFSGCYNSGGRHGDVEAPGDDFPSDRVPGRMSELPRSEIDDDGRDGTFRGIWSFLLEFLRRVEYIGEGWAPGASQGHHTPPGRGPTFGRALLGCGPLGAPPRVISGLQKLPDLLYSEEKIFSDFDDIFRVGFSKTKNSRNTELALGHLVNRLVP